MNTLSSIPFVFLVLMYDVQFVSYRLIFLTYRINYAVETTSQESQELVILCV